MSSKEPAPTPAPASTPEGASAEAARAARSRAQQRSALALLVVAGMGVYAGLRMEVSTEITHFLPEGEDQALGRLSRELSRSALSRSVTLTVEAPDRREAARAAAELADRLRPSPLFSWVASGPGAGLEEAFYTLYFPRRFALMSSDPAREIPRMTSEAALRERARALKHQLSLPTGAFVRRIALSDPWLLFPAHLERLRALQGEGLEVEEGSFVAREGSFGVVFLRTASSAFEGRSQAAVAEAIEGAFREVDRAHRGRLSLEQSGVYRFALQSERSIRADITRISVLSSLGILLLFLILFRSPRTLLLSFLPLLVGMTAAVFFGLLFFGRLHGLTLAFGATMIGVSIDYVAHAFNHHVLAPSPEGPEGSLRKIGPGLILGAATTVAGLAGLAWTSFPGVREMAVFTSVGVSFALIATRWLLPPFMPLAPTPSPLHARLARLTEELMARLRRARLGAGLFALLALGVAVVGIARLRVEDDVRALNALDPGLLAEDERVRGRISQMDGGRLVVALGEDLEGALRANDRAYLALTAAKEAGELASFRSLHPLLPSARLQEETLRALRREHARRDLAAASRRALEAEGFVGEAFAPFGATLEEALGEGAAAPLTLEALERSSLRPMVRPFVVPLEGRVAVITLVRGVDAAALGARLDRVEGALLFDQAAFMNSAYGRFRERTLELMGVGLVLVLLMVWLRYRRLGLALAAFAPALLAAAATLGLVGLLGRPATLMHSMALLLVLSMGVDYGVFMVESRDHREGPAPTLLSLALACASTCLSFGLLAMSENPALHAIGFVSGVGVLLSLLLAPAAWILAGSPSAAPAEEAAAEEPAAEEER